MSEVVDSTSVAIRVMHLAKAYREGEQRRVVFDDLSAEFYRSQTTAVVGRSGTGKSTLLNLMSGIDLPDRGEVEIDDVSLTRLSEKERTLFRRRAIGFVFQFFNLIPTLTVAENLRLPLELLGVGATEIASRVDRLLRQVGLTARAESFPDRLAGGEQQRVAVARALIHEPVVVLADEPTGNLDAETGREVLELLIEMTRRSRASLVVVTHSEEVLRYADRVLALNEGRLVVRPE